MQKLTIVTNLIHSFCHVKVKVRIFVSNRRKIFNASNKLNGFNYTSRSIGQTCVNRSWTIRILSFFLKHLIYQFKLVFVHATKLINVCRFRIFFISKKMFNVRFCRCTHEIIGDVFIFSFIKLFDSRTSKSINNSEN